MIVLVRGGMFATLHSAALVGVEAVPVEVEVNTGEVGDLRLEIVGLPDKGVKESEDRVLSALQNTGLRGYETKTTINLAPGDLRKEGSMYDLPIAIGMAAATRQISKNKLSDYLIAGELGLSGGTRAVKGGVAIALLAKKLKLKGVILPRASAEEAALVKDIEAVAVDSLDGALRFLSNDPKYQPLPPRDENLLLTTDDGEPDFSEVKGQIKVRRAVEVAAAGGHNIIILGPPGSGKSLIAKRLPSILPTPQRR